VGEDQGEGDTYFYPHLELLSSMKLYSENTKIGKKE